VFFFFLCTKNVSKVFESKDTECEQRGEPTHPCKDEQKVEGGGRGREGLIKGLRENLKAIK
jgi:hypothetical protein